MGDDWDFLAVADMELDPAGDAAYRQLKNYEDDQAYTAVWPDPSEEDQV